MKQACILIELENLLLQVWLTCAGEVLRGKIEQAGIKSLRKTNCCPNRIQILSRDDLNKRGLVTRA